MSFDYNEKYEFVSDGTWFDKGTRAMPEFLWLGFEHGGETEMSYETLLKRKDEISGLFFGLRDNKADEEVCGLDEFDIVYNTDDFILPSQEELAKIISEPLRKKY